MSTNPFVQQAGVKTTIYNTVTEISTGKRSIKKYTFDQVQWSILMEGLKNPPKKALMRCPGRMKPPAPLYPPNIPSNTRSLSVRELTVQNQDEIHETIQNDSNTPKAKKNIVLDGQLKGDDN
jgi:hypothetical protein